MRSDERIRELCAQLLRAEHPAVIETVSAELHEAIDKYVRIRAAQASPLVSPIYLDAA